MGDGRGPLQRMDESAKGETTPAPQVRTRYKKFTGKRREKIRKICACGCGQKFTTTEPRKIYKNDAHRKRKDRARMRTKLQNEV